MSQAADESLAMLELELASAPPTSLPPATAAPIPVPSLSWQDSIPLHCSCWQHCCAEPPSFHPAAAAASSGPPASGCRSIALMLPLTPLWLWNTAPAQNTSPCCGAWRCPLPGSCCYCRQPVTSLQAESCQVGGSGISPVGLVQLPLHVLLTQDRYYPSGLQHMCTKGQTGRVLLMSRDTTVVRSAILIQSALHPAHLWDTNAYHQLVADMYSSYSTCSCSCTC